MARKAFYFDQTACIACKACMIACKDKMEQELNLGVFYRTVTTYETGSFPKVGRFNVSIACNHCDSPACMAACATGAIYKNEEGYVLYSPSVCDGCGSCVEICPYKAPKLVDGKMAKCNGCADRALNGSRPSCVDACTMRALDFGDYDELVAKYGSDLVADLSVLPDSTMTNPGLLIKARECAKSGETKVLAI